MKTPSLKIPDYIILQNLSNVQEGSIKCDHCNRLLKHPNLIKDTKTNREFYLGNTCTLNFLGKSIKDIKSETEDFEKETQKINEMKLSENKKEECIKTFKEVNEDMMKYIINNQDNSFIKSMKNRIEETGTLSKNMYSVVYSMMLPVANLDSKNKDLSFRLIRVMKKEGEYGSNYTLFGETTEGLIRIFFSSLDKVKDLLIDKKVIDYDGMFFEDVLDKNIYMKVSGTFDGYKIKRAKLNS